MGVGLGQLSQSVVEPFRLINIFFKTYTVCFLWYESFWTHSVLFYFHIFIYILYISFTFTIYTYYSYCNSSRSLTYIVTFMKKKVFKPRGLLPIWRCNQHDVCDPVQKPMGQLVREWSKGCEGRLSNEGRLKGLEYFNTWMSHDVVETSSFNSIYRDFSHTVHIGLIYLPLRLKIIPSIQLIFKVVVMLIAPADSVWNWHDGWWSQILSSS